MKKRDGEMGWLLCGCLGRATGREIQQRRKEKMEKKNGCPPLGCVGRGNKIKKGRKKCGGRGSRLGMEMGGEKRKNGKEEIRGSGHVGVSKGRERRKNEAKKKIGARVGVFG